MTTSQPWTGLSGNSWANSRDHESDYTLDPAAEVPSIVKGGAGPQSTIGG